jgi:hypothetical protein
MATRIYRPLKVIAFDASGIGRQGYELSKQLQDPRPQGQYKENFELHAIQVLSTETEPRVVLIAAVEDTLQGFVGKDRRAGSVV